MSSTVPPFPADRDGQTYATVQAAVAGHIWLHDSRAYLDATDEPEDQGNWVPAFSFLITHPTRGKALFDLGVRKHGEGYPPAIVDRIRTFKPDCKLDIADVLLAGGVDPSEIDTVIYSHMHWDHIGDPDRIPHARIVLGEESRSLLEDPYPPNLNSRFLALPASRSIEYIDFRPVSSATANTSINLIKPFGPFDVARDIYGDGSVYLVDAPGHVAGHMLAAARVGPNAFVLLAGDTCHSRECYAGARRAISKEMYADYEVAQETVLRLGSVDSELDDVLVILAHEWEREREIPLFPLELNGWVKKQVEERKEERQRGHRLG